MDRKAFPGRGRSTVRVRQRAGSATGRRAASASTGHHCLPARVGRPPRPEVRDRWRTGGRAADPREEVRSGRRRVGVQAGARCGRPRSAGRGQWMPGSRRLRPPRPALPRRPHRSRGHHRAAGRPERPLRSRRKVRVSPEPPALRRPPQRRNRRPGPLSRALSAPTAAGKRMAGRPAADGPVVERWAADRATAPRVRACVEGVAARGRNHCAEPSAHPAVPRPCPAPHRSARPPPIGARAARRPPTAVRAARLRPTSPQRSSEPEHSPRTRAEQPPERARSVAAGACRRSAAPRAQGSPAPRGPLRAPARRVRQG